MNSVKFDQIHTEKKQLLLAEMMQQVNDEVCKVLNLMKDVYLPSVSNSKYRILQTSVQF